MDVDSYIAKYEPDWRRLEQAVAKGGPGISRQKGEEIAEIVRLYQRTSAQLTEVRSKYRDPELERYLNNLTTKAHGAIYSARSRTTKGFWAIFGSRYRTAFRETIPFILVAAGILIVFTFASWAWVAHSPQARAGILTPEVRHAIANAGGARDPSLGPAPGLSTYIFLNNMRVSLLAFALGITAGVGTVYFVIQNALLLGELAGTFQAAGKAGAFWAVIIPHGLLELTAICIGAGAGLRMGWAIIAPGDRPRSRALSEEAGQALIVAVGVVPAFALAAFIEGFITRTSLPDFLEITIGVIAWAGYVCFLYGRIPGFGVRAVRRP